MTAEAVRALQELLPFATPIQAGYINAIISEGSQTKAARKLRLHPRTIEKGLARIRDRAAAGEYGVRPPVTEGMVVDRTTTLVDGSGNQIMQWVRARADEAQRETILREALAAYTDKLPRAAPSKASPQGNTDLATCYILTDYHLGMLAWHEETGADWDIRIAEELLTRWFAAAIESTPKAHTGILAQLGDFLHIDNLDAVTPAHKNSLDADTRLQKVVRVAIRSVRRIIAMLLEKHPHVHVIMADANHDPAGSIWLREWIAAHYEADPRITVDLGADGYYCFEHGDTSLFFHHGHKRKPENVDDVFAAKYREVFGRTKYSYAHMGHMHHVKRIESPLMIVEQHRTLAAPDAYASRGGYMSGRSASAITYHKDSGEVGRVTITPKMVSGQ